jgi:hypothetical protein
MGYPDDERSANDPMHNAETGLPELAITGGNPPEKQR